MKKWRRSKKLVSIKPQSDIHYNRSATSPRPKIHNDRRGRRGVATRFCSWSATGRRLIGDWLPTDRRLVGDLVGTSLRLDATSRRPSKLKKCDKEEKHLILSFKTDELNMVHSLSFIHYVTKPCGEWMRHWVYFHIYLHRLKALTYKNNTNNKDM